MQSGSRNHRDDTGEAERRSTEPNKAGSEDQSKMRIWICNSRKETLCCSWWRRDLVKKRSSFAENLAPLKLNYWALGFQISEGDVSLSFSLLSHFLSLSKNLIRGKEPRQKWKYPVFVLVLFDLFVWGYIPALWFLFLFFLFVGLVIFYLKVNQSLRIRSSHVYCRRFWSWKHFDDQTCRKFWVAKISSFTYIGVKEPIKDAPGAGWVGV